MLAFSIFENIAVSTLQTLYEKCVQTYEFLMIVEDIVHAIEQRNIAVSATKVCDNIASVEKLSLNHQMHQNKILLKTFSKYRIRKRYKCKPSIINI